MILHSSVVNSQNIECSDGTSSFKSLTDNEYACVIENIVSFGNFRQTINIRYFGAMTNRDVKVLNIDSVSNLKYFPSTAAFQNLFAIYIDNSDLVEVSQNDLRDFDKLKILSLRKNKIKIIEKDLFKFNSKLEIIFLDKNEIAFIAPTVFDHLSQLRELDLEDNDCALPYAKTRSKVLKTIARINRGICTSPINSFTQNESFNSLPLYRFSKNNDFNSTSTTSTSQNQDLTNT